MFELGHLIGATGWLSEIGEDECCGEDTFALDIVLDEHDIFLSESKMRVNRRRLKPELRLLWLSIVIA